MLSNNSKFPLFSFFGNEVGIDSWTSRAFSKEIYRSEQMFEKIKKSQNMIETNFPQSKYLVYYGELFSVLS